jgi:integrase
MPRWAPIAMSMPFAPYPLEHECLAPNSLRAYNKALHTFLDYHHLTYQQFLSTHPQLLDELFAEFLQHQHDLGGSFTYASHAVNAAVHHRFDLKGKLGRAHRCLKAWSKKQITRSHPPLTWEVTVLLACSMLRGGYLGAAVGMLTAFDCYLRVSELCNIRRSHVVKHIGPRNRAFTDVAVILPQTKTGVNQSVPVWDHDVATILWAWVSSPHVGASSDARVFDFSPTLLRRLIHRCCQAQRLHGIPYTPHSLRHGGATFDFMRTGDVSFVQFRGRWASMESARRYIQTTRAMLSFHQAPAESTELGRQLSFDLVPIFSVSFASIAPAAASITRPRHVSFRL